MMNMGNTAGLLQGLSDMDDLTKELNEMKQDEIPCIHIVEVTAPMNVDDNVKDRLNALCEGLTDDEMAYAIIYFDAELEMRKEQALDNADCYCPMDYEDPEDEYED